MGNPSHKIAPTNIENTHISSPKGQKSRLNSQSHSFIQPNPITLKPYYKLKTVMDPYTESCRFGMETIWLACPKGENGLTKLP